MFSKRLPSGLVLFRQSSGSNIQEIVATKRDGWNPLIYRGKRSYTKNNTNTVKDNYTGLIW
jgi:hypothetical protein